MSTISLSSLSRCFAPFEIRVDNIYTDLLPRFTKNGE